MNVEMNPNRFNQRGNLSVMLECKFRIMYDLGARREGSWRKYVSFFGAARCNMRND